MASRHTPRAGYFQYLTIHSGCAMSTTPTLSHLDESGQIRMVDVGHKTDTDRVAIARGSVRMNATAYGLLTQPGQGKGEVLNTARVAAVLAAKRCAELIPLCHSLPLAFVGIDFELDEAAHSVHVRATCRTQYKTGVEMEAMTACSVAALTIYDMCKAADKGIVIEQIRLQYKAGGKSGEWRND
ncbi:molybdenum cofactor biosynthesis protein C [Bordetella bronchiseptica 00-P-2796]|nr:molybdenum cofactor biosynthesis protein C [Bordetella bronchiseptica 00-P-2796]